MKLVECNLSDNWRLIALDPCEPSPMENHLGGDIATDNSSRTFFVHEVFLVTYGLDAITKSCQSYIDKHEPHKHVTHIVKSQIEYKTIHAALKDRLLRVKQ